MKIREVTFAPEAQDDIDALFKHVALNAGEAVAITYIARIEKFIFKLEVASERGQLRSDIRQGLRIIGFASSASNAASRLRLRLMRAT